MLVSVLSDIHVDSHIAAIQHGPSQLIISYDSHDDDLAINQMPVAEVIRKKSRDCCDCSACNFSTNRHRHPCRHHVDSAALNQGVEDSGSHVDHSCSLYANKLPTEAQLQKACAPPILANCCSRSMRCDGVERMNGIGIISTHHLLRSKNNIKDNCCNCRLIT